MGMPTEQDFRNSATNFSRRCGVEHCLGAIDGRHIRIQKPKKTGSEYRNYKQYFSVVLLAVVDFNYRFIFIDVGGYGSQSDGGTLTASDFYQALIENKLKIPEKSKLPGSEFEVPYFFVGDGAFPLMERIMKPVKGTNLSEAELKFNKRISGARVRVENAFAFLCQKWRIFYTTINLEPNVVDWIVKCTCIIHNILIDLGEVNLENFVSDLDLDIIAAPLQANEKEDVVAHLEPNTNNAKIIQEFLVNYFENNPF